MAFGNSQQVIEEKKEFDINDRDDLEVVQSFEKEIKPYEARSITLFPGTPDEKTLKGYQLYLHENNLLRYTDKYKTGAMVRENLDEFHLVVMKKKALDALNFKREKARSYDRERANSLVNDKSEIERGMKI